MKLRYYIIRRLLLLIPIIFGITFVAFFLSHIIGDPTSAYTGERTPEAVRELIIEIHHLNDPIYIQYFYYIDSLLHLDLGISPTDGNRPVIESIANYFPATIELTVTAMIISVIVGIPLGMISATHKDRPLDHGSRVFSLAGVSLPIFWLGLILLYLFYFIIPIFPSGGRLDIGSPPPPPVTGLYTIDSLLAGDLGKFAEAVKHLILPAVTLSFASLAIITRMMRSSMLEVLGQDYIRTARSKGLTERAVNLRHAMKNAMIPTTTVIGLAVGALLSGTVLTEIIYRWPGLGRWSVEAITRLDHAAIMGFVLLVAIIFVMSNLIVDIIYSFLDPRIRY
jgi:peptide/nickel transport system permease protein